MIRLCVARALSDLARNGRIHALTTELVGGPERSVDEDPRHPVTCRIAKHVLGG